MEKDRASRPSAGRRTEREPLEIWSWPQKRNINGLVDTCENYQELTFPAWTLTVFQSCVLLFRTQHWQAKPPPRRLYQPSNTASKFLWISYRCIQNRITILLYTIQREDFIKAVWHNLVCWQNPHCAEQIFQKQQESCVSWWDKNYFHTLSQNCSYQTEAGTQEGTGCKIQISKLMLAAITLPNNI